MYKAGIIVCEKCCEPAYIILWFLKIISERLCANFYTINRIETKKKNLRVYELAALLKNIYKYF